MPKSSTDILSDLVDPTAYQTQPTPTPTTVRGVSMIRLTQVYGYETRKHREIWVNPAQVRFIADAGKGEAQIHFGDDDFIVVATDAIEVVWLIEQAMP